MHERRRSVAVKNDGHSATAGDIRPTRVMRCRYQPAAFHRSVGGSRAPGACGKLPRGKGDPAWRRSVLPLVMFRVVSALEARVGLVPASVFKTDDALREQRHGGFDSHALPPFTLISAIAAAEVGGDAVSESTAQRLACWASLP